ncbi:MAG: Rne/Rng family ribonuclease [Candidatus Omnitrophica bacterium]|nr:Rne/Rng family ribonuclease [Candidatus Omnitrophota bacterium]
MSKYKIFINNEKVILRIVIEKDSRIERFFVYKENFEPEIGNIYKGKIEKFLPGINSTFVNIGEMKSGFLQIDQFNTYYDIDEYEEKDALPKIFIPEKEILVQICKPGEDGKSPKLTEKISLPGRYFVLFPNLKIQKISQKIKDTKERKRLMKIFKREIGEKFGYIVRTAAMGKKEIFIQREIQNILRIWKRIKRDYKKKTSPSLLWREIPLYLKVIRDYVNEDYELVEVDDEFIFSQIKKYVNLFIPELRGKIYLYSKKIPMFIQYGLEDKIKEFLSDKVFLPSGGYLIIEKGRTITTIDVNSGKTEEQNLEETILKTNLEAAEEIPRQIICRNISGIIIVDFIDMKEENRKKVFKKFIENFRNDKSKTDILFISKFGLVEMLREKNDYSIYNILFKECDSCAGLRFKKDKELIFLELKKIIFEFFSHKGYNYKLKIEISPDLYEFIFKKGLFKNFIFFDRIKFEVVDNFGSRDFKIVERF